MGWRQHPVAAVPGRDERLPARASAREHNPIFRAGEHSGGHSMRHDVSDSVIQLGHLTKRYPGDSHPAVDGVDLEFGAAEAVAVMGPSGSVKSTLLNLIAGLDRPTSGTITVAGQRIDALSETAVARFRRREIVMVFQFFNLLEDLSVFDNVLLRAQLAGTQ